MAKNEVEEIKIRLVVVCGCTIAWNERWGTTNAAELKVEGLETRRDELRGHLPVVDVGGRIRQTDSVLNV